MKMTSRWLTNRSALEPENPVRYRMLGRLVTNKPSTCAAVSPSASAARRRGRASDTGAKLARQPAQRELVAVCAQSDDDADGRRSEHRVPPFGLAGIHVRHMYLDERNGNRAQRIANGETAVRVRPRVDDDAVDLPAQRVNGVDQ